MPTLPEIVLVPKSVLRPPIWVSRNNHVGHMVAVSDLLDASYTTIPGYTIQMEIKAPVIVSSCLYLFSIMRHQAKIRRPVFQLEVAPNDKRTHNGTPPIYGPHLHCGDEEPEPVQHPDVHCGDWAGSLKWFLEQARIEPFSMDDPEDVRL